MPADGAIKREDEELAVRVREFDSLDSSSWLRCRALAFLSTNYFDDVRPAKAAGECAVELVAVVDADVVGLLDVTVDSKTATIDTVAVLPEYRSRGVASNLLESALGRLNGSGVLTIDAWTREDAPANAWYTHHGFVERFRYLHVYAASREELDTITGPAGLTPAQLFMHARIEDEARIRSEYARVYVCRQYRRDV